MSSVASSANKGIVPATKAVVPATKVTRAMVMAAGLGERMRPLTDDRPKPLVCVNGKTLLDHGLDRLDEAGVKTAVVNVHYLADMITDHLKTRKSPGIIISDERETLLNTGGGTKHAMPHLGPDPFFTLNTDALWTEGKIPTLTAMAEAFDTRTMDALLLLAPTIGNLGFSGAGDFYQDPQGRLQRRGTKPAAPFVFAGVTLTHPRLFENAPDGAYSTNILWDQAIKTERLFGHLHTGKWMHVGTPKSVEEANAAFRDQIAP